MEFTLTFNMTTSHLRRKYPGPRHPRDREDNTLIPRAMATTTETESIPIYQLLGHYIEHFGELKRIK